MVSYFVHFKETGIIGLIGAVISGLYTYAVGFILNFAIKRTKYTDLRLRIAATSGVFGLAKEIIASKNQSFHTRTTILIFILILTLAGKSISFLVTSGIRASTGIQFGVSTLFAVNLTYCPTLSQPTRGNYSTMLSSLYNWHEDNDMAVDFKILSNTTPGRIYAVWSGIVGNQISPDPFVPGEFGVIRQLYTFSDETLGCENTTANCSLTSMRAQLSTAANLAQVLDTPVRVLYNGSTLVDVSPAIAPATAARDAFLAERPTTMITTYTDKYGTSVYIAVTTASFQLSIYSYTVGDDLVNAAQSLIGSTHPLYQEIFVALNSSAFTPPLVGFNATTKATLVFNTPKSGADNSTLINCVGYEANQYNTDHQNPAKNMISCREVRISVLLEHGGAEQQVDGDLPIDVFNIYNAMAPTLMEQDDIDDGNMVVESVETVAQDMSVLLKEIADRLYPLNAVVSGQVTPYTYIQGISFELWSLVFIVAMVVFVGVTFLLDFFLNDDIARADLATLIEHATSAHEMPMNEEIRDREKSEYPPWALVKDGTTYQITLRRMPITLQSSDSQRLKD